MHETLGTTVNNITQVVEMSEKKEGDEEMVDSEHESSESDQMVETDIRHREDEDDDSPDMSPEHDDNDNDNDNDNSSEDGEEALLNGEDHSYSPKVQPFDGGSSSDEVKVDAITNTTTIAAAANNNSNVVMKNNLEQVVVNGNGGDNNNVEKLRDVEELIKDVEESKAVVEYKEEKVSDLVVSRHLMEENGVKEEKFVRHEAVTPLPYAVMTEGLNQSFPSHLYSTEGEDADGTEAEQAAFAKELEGFFRERGLDFKHPKFYGEGLNCLKLWRAVTRLGGYDRVTACKLWRQVGESFKPPKTCTTVSWSFRIFYEKALLDYERHKTRGGELIIPASPLPEALSIDNQLHSGSGRARRDAAARAMQGWHSQRLLGNGEVGEPIMRDKNSLSSSKREKHLKSVGMNGLLKRKKPIMLDRSVKAARTITKVMRPQIDTDVADIGPAADWVKISVRRTKDCFEVYALVPGLLREEVRVQSDPAGRLVISGEPEQPDNPWGVTPFKKVITLPSRIDPHQTSAVVTLHGQLFVRVPFEPTDL